MSTFWIATVIMLLGGIVAFWLGRDIREGASVPLFAGCLIVIVGAGSIIVAMTSLGTISMNLLWRIGFLTVFCFVAGFLYRYLIASFVAQAVDSFLFSFADVRGGKRTHDIAQKYESEEAYSEAVREYKMAITETPDDLDARFGLAKVYCQMEDYDKAIEQYEDLLMHRDKLDMDQHCMIMNRLADLNLTRREDIERGKYWLEQIVRTYPRSKYATFAQQRIRRVDSQARNSSRHSTRNV